jgi:hypothetical protein
MTLTKKNVSNEKVYVFKINENLKHYIERAKSIIDNSKKNTDASTNSPVDAFSHINQKLETHEETYQSKIEKRDSNSLLLNPDLEGLHSWFQECINFVMKDLGLEKQELEITHSWGNKFDKLKFSERHTDKNSLITGIFVLSDAENKNIFLRYDRSVWYKMMLNHGGSCNWYTDLCTGQLILFPSSVPHGTTPGKESENSLYTISFNTFLKGFQKQNLNYKEIEASI